MPKIKIISNPYQKTVEFFKWDNNAEEWNIINYENNRNSNLLNQELISGFFPFKVKRIVDLLVEEYGIADEELLIVFEGTADEYSELVSACQDFEYACAVTPIRAPRCLENARDILPAVRDLFQKMSPLIAKSVDQSKIQWDINRFVDAASDVVPVCVLGSYSAGKSTFINALIGCEILPTGTEVVTAKTYMISRSKYPDRAFVKCLYHGKDVYVNFTDTDTSFENILLDNELTLALREELTPMAGTSLIERVNRALSIINEYENLDKDSIDISDMIEVEIPFNRGVLAQSQHPFVIFDTPGSNSASNTHHLEVLKHAMANMTNGLPIFLATPETLDTNDNEELYHIIRDYDELDNRFTMIVVNKADGLVPSRKGPVENDETRILRQAVPRNLYSSGLFYVSSILGLGAKIDGDFMDDFYAETYDDHVHKYNNPEDRRYRTLYTYNIMPAQLKNRAIAHAGRETDLVYVNSGLYSIEDEIEAFAGKYSAYNKCFQSQLFLGRVIQATEDQIAADTRETEELRQSISDKLESDKKNLVGKLQAEAATHQKAGISDYQTHMQTFLDTAETTFAVEELKTQLAEFTRMHQESQGLDTIQGDSKKARAALSSNFISNIKSAAKERSLSSVKGVFGDLQSDLKASKDTMISEWETKRAIDQAAANSLMDFVAERYKESLSEICGLIDRQSQAYWAEKTEDIRNALVAIVSGSDVLTDERRAELERIIITYEKITFKDSKPAEIFKKVNFSWKLQLGDAVIFESNRLKVDKVASTYNTQLSKDANTRFTAIQSSHGDSAAAWIQSLLDEIRTNIVKYSPELSKQANQSRL